MTNELEIQRVFTAGETPDDEQFHDWFGLVSTQLHVKGSLVIRLVDEAESQQLNLSYRGKDSSTNVLSFPFEAPPNIEDNHIGDLVICVPVVNREAMAQNKLQNHHWAHIVLHGILHLLGYDHIDDDEATKMEQMEIDLLNELGISNPYEAQ
ncbi:MAG: rRNA maturation RNase YbeY [Gammaproteobacteria bacterium]|jgi:probable rRNA maturation factor